MQTPLLAESKRDCSIGHIFCVCASTLGFETAFNVLFSLSEPIMDELDLSSTAEFLCWLAGPIAGLTLLPIVGVWSDRCTSKFGRRRPFIVAGSFFTIIGFGLLLLLKAYSSRMNKTVRTVCMFFILFLNYASINTMMAPSRALIGDIIPEHQQDLANAIASILIGLSSVLPNIVGGVGYFIKNSSYSERAMNVTLYFCLGMIFCCVTTTLIVGKEQPLVLSEKDQVQENKFVQMFKEIKNMPSPIARACILMILSWVANYMYTMMGTDFFMQEVFATESQYKGLCFGMLVIASSNAFSFLYGCFHAKCVEVFGDKIVYGVSHLIEAISLASVFFVHNKWILLAFMTPIGMAITNFNSTPYALVSLAVNEELMGIYMSVLSSCIDISFIIANVSMNLGMGLVYDKFVPKSWGFTKLQVLIGISSLWAIAAAIFSAFIIVPKHRLDHTLNTDNINTNDDYMFHVSNSIESISQYGGEEDRRE